MAVLSVGSRWTSKASGKVYEILALAPHILYSPVTTYDTVVANARIYSRDPDDFLLYFNEGDFVAFGLTYLGQPLSVNGQPLLRTSI